MSKDFFGVGWQFPVESDDDGQIVMARHEKSIQQSIWIILGTARGGKVG